jgi:hypothetical protein
MHGFEFLILSGLALIVIGALIAAWQDNDQ